MHCVPLLSVCCLLVRHDGLLSALLLGSCRQTYSQLRLSDVRLVLIMLVATPCTSYSVSCRLAISVGILRHAAIACCLAACCKCSLRACPVSTLCFLRACLACRWHSVCLASCLSASRQLHALPAVSHCVLAADSWRHVSLSVWLRACVERSLSAVRVAIVPLRCLPACRARRVRCAGRLPITTLRNVWKRYAREMRQCSKTSQMLQ